jgi:hypothetical protein
VNVQVGVSDGVYAAVQSSEGAEEGDAPLAEGDRLVIGLLRPEDARRKPSVSLGGSKK